MQVLKEVAESKSMSIVNVATTNQYQAMSGILSGGLVLFMDFLCVKRNLCLKVT